MNPCLQKVKSSKFFILLKVSTVTVSRLQLSIDSVNWTFFPSISDIRQHDTVAQSLDVEHDVLLDKVVNPDVTPVQSENAVIWTGVINPLMLQQPNTLFWDRPKFKEVAEDN